MIPNRKIFCNAPWFELHVYWDGGLGFCCQENHRLYNKDEYSTYNIKNMSIREWTNSLPMKNVRKQMFGNSELSICHRCIIEDRNQGRSRRNKSNSGSAIFTKNNFDESFKQSPHRDIFIQSFENDGYLDGYPIDLHIDFGNYCNLACKMCDPFASSKVASQYSKWGIDFLDKKKNPLDKKILVDWTQDQEVWDRFCEELAGFDNLANVHFMGGEPMLAKRFLDFLDFMIEKNKTHIGISFVTNGTIINNDILDRLKHFTKRVNIEISIETTSKHNSYIRQGTDTDQVLQNIQKIKNLCDTNGWDITIRPAISSLSVGYYYTLLEYCYKNELLIKSVTVNYPEYLKVEHLPDNVKNEYKQKYLNSSIYNEVFDEDYNIDFNESDRYEFKKIIKKDIEQCIKLLSDKQSVESRDKLKELSTWCSRWDQVYHFNAKELYPEFKEFLKTYDY